MSIYMFILLMASPSSALNIRGQSLDEAKVSIYLQKATISQIFKAIEKQSSFYFVYDSKISQNANRISFNDNGISVRKVLEKISRKARLKFRRVNLSISVNIIPEKEVEIVIAIAREISGKVTDKNGEPLLGVNILVKGTNFGTSTDFDGNFTLEIPDDAKIIVVSYIGYKTQEIAVEGKSNFDIKLEESARALAEVVVKGIRESLSKAVEIKKQSVNNIDAIVAEDIAKFPQSNVSEALQRVSGIQIRRDNAGGVGNEVSIRGLPSEYTQVTVNGDVAPNSSDGRSYNFNTLPAEIFSRVEVSKTPTAKMAEGGIGGSVNLVTRKPFEIDKRIFVGTLDGIYNTQQQHGANITPKTSLTYGNKWNDKFGVIASVSYNKFFNNSEGYDVTRYYFKSYDLDGDGTDDFENIRVPRPRYVSQGQEVDRLTFNLTTQWQVTDIFNLVFTGVYTKNNQMETRYTPIWFLPGDNPTNIITDGPFVKFIEYEEVLSKLENQQQTNNTKNHLFGITGKWRFDNGWKIGSKLKYALNTRDSERFRYYADNRNTASYSIINNTTFFDLQTPTNFSDASQFFMSQARHYLWDNDDEIFTGKLDFAKKIWNKLVIEFGSSYRSRTKTRKYFYDRVTGINKPFAPVAALLTGFLDNEKNARGLNQFLVHDWDKSYDLYGGKIDLTNKEIINAYYDINEAISAGYLQGNFNSKRFDANFGVRYINTSITSKGFEIDDITEVATEREVKSNYTDFLPTINLKYKFSRNIFAKASFARVLTRPRIQDLSSYRVVDDVNKRISAKNPELNPFRANQYDISLEWYPVKEALLSASLFKKDIESFITTQTKIIQFQEEDYELRQPVNGNDATIKGVELNYQHPFTFLPSPFDGLGIVANYTYSESDFKEQISDGVVETYSLPNNSKRSYNIIGYYEKYGFGFRVAHNFRSSYLREKPNPEDGLKYRDDIGITDISASYDFTKNIGITMNVLNAFNTKRYEYIWERQYMDNASFFGTTFQFGLRATF